MKVQIGTKTWLKSQNVEELLNKLYGKVDIFEPQHVRNRELVKILNHSTNEEYTTNLTYPVSFLSDAIQEVAKSYIKDNLLKEDKVALMYDLYIHRKYYDNIRVRFNDKFYLISDTVEKVQYYSVKIDNYVYTILPNCYVSNNLTAYHTKGEEEFDAIIITDLDTKNSMLIERPFIDAVKPAVQLSTQTYDKFINNDEMYKLLDMSKEQIELFNSISDSNREKNIFSFIYKYANIQIDNSEEYEYNTVTYDEKSEEATLHLVDTKRENRIKILIPKTGYFKFFVNGVKTTKAGMKSMQACIPTHFEDIPDCSNFSNRIKNFEYLLRNLNDFKSFYQRNTSYYDYNTRRPRQIIVNDLIDLLYSDKLEGLFSVYGKIPALKQLNDWSDEDRANYLIKIFDIYKNNSLVRELKSSFFDTVPRVNMLFEIDSLKAVTGIRLMHMCDTGTGVFNIISRFSTDELKIVGELFLEFYFLLTRAFGDINAQLDYIENRDKALDDFIKQIKIVDNRIIELLSFDTTFKSVEGELKRYIELFNLVLFRNNDTRDIYYSVYENDVKDWYLYDMLNMYFSVYKDRKIKDFTNNIKHSIEENSIKAFHDTLAETYNAIKQELAEEEYAKVLKTYTYKSYVGKNFSIIAPPTLIAIVQEGEALKHCVSSYINRVLRKETFIFFLRANDNLDTPLVTIEVRDNEILQASGMYNRRLKSDSEEMKTILEFAKLNGIKVNTYYVCI